MRKIEGVFVKHHKEKTSHIQNIKAMMMVNNPEGLSAASYINNVELPKPKRPYQPRLKARHPHKQLEKKLQRDIILYLRGKGAICGKVNATAGVYNNVRLKSGLLFVGVPDLLCFHNNRMWWIEVKIFTGTIYPKQDLFANYCFMANINHIIARCLNDVDVILKK